MGKYKGSYTVEAAMVVPIIIVIFCMVINATLYVHDRCALAAGVYEIALRGNAYTYKTNNTIEELLQKEFVELMDEVLLLTEIHDIEVKVSEMKIKIKCSGTMEYFLTQDMNVEKEISRNQSIPKIRLERRLK